MLVRPRKAHRDKDVVDDRTGVVSRECSMCDEASVEGGAREEIDGEIEVGGRGDLAALLRLFKEAPGGFAPARSFAGSGPSCGSSCAAACPPRRTCS